MTSRTPSVSCSSSRAPAGPVRLVGAALIVSLGACTSLAPQLPATDFEQLEQLSTREAREYAYEQNRVETHREMNGLRFTKGDDPNAPKLGWQSLDRVLRSDRHAAAALPDKKRRLVRVFTGLTFASAIASTAGVAGTAREGLDTSSLSGSSSLLLFGGLLTVGFAVTAGILYGRMKRDYIGAVDIYNDSLGLQLGLYDPAGKYLPPAGTLLDEDGFVILSDDEVAAERQGAPAPRDSVAPESAAPEVGSPEGPRPAPDTAPPDGSTNPDPASDEPVGADPESPVEPAAPKIQSPRGSQGAPSSSPATSKPSDDSPSVDPSSPPPGRRLGLGLGSR